MRQVLVIHGGNSFSSYKAYRTYLGAKELNYYKLTHPIRWKERLSSELKDIDVLYPTMPNNLNAVYDEWVIMFNKLLPLLGSDVQMIGHSLGAMFLAKHLNDQPLDQKIRRLILVAPAYNNEDIEDLGSFKVSSASQLPRSAEEIHLFHSQDDPVVPFSELAKFQADLPDASSHIFTDRGHFTDEVFPEVAELLKQK